MERRFLMDKSLHKGYLAHTILASQQESDTTDEDKQDTQTAGGTQKGKGQGKADKRRKKPVVLSSAEE